MPWSQYIRLELDFENAFARQSCRKPHSLRVHVYHAFGLSTTRHNMIWGRVFRQFAARRGFHFGSMPPRWGSSDGERERKSYVHGLRQGLEDPTGTCIFWEIHTYIAGLSGYLHRFHRNCMNHNLFPGTFSMQVHEEHVA